MGPGDQLRGTESLGLLAVPTLLITPPAQRRFVASQGLIGTLTPTLTTTLTGAGRDGRADKCAALEKP
jgi:hypothetical protein